LRKYWRSNLGRVAPGCDQQFLSDFGKIFPFLQSIFHEEFWGRFTLLGWQLTGSALALSGTLPQILWPKGLYLDFLGKVYGHLVAIGHLCPPFYVAISGHSWPYST
jgi:hypothetical protein